jgi:hypothetical protein
MLKEVISFSWLALLQQVCWPINQNIYRLPQILQNPAAQVADIYHTALAILFYKGSFYSPFKQALSYPYIQLAISTDVAVTSLISSLTE